MRRRRRGPEERKGVGRTESVCANWDGKAWGDNSEEMTTLEDIGPSATCWRSVQWCQRIESFGKTPTVT